MFSEEYKWNIGYKWVKNTALKLLLFVKYDISGSS